MGPAIAGACLARGERDYRMGGAGMRLCLAFWKRSPITVRLAAWLMVLRSAQRSSPSIALRAS
jgi:hypothetical protein